MSFGIYIGGFLVLIAGLIYGAVILHVPTQWVVVGGIVLTGLGILSGVKATRQKDTSS
jgi:cadmium resistance protein CadD (predicted permease)